MFLPENLPDDTLPPATCNLQLGVAALSCDSFHHYYHYQSSLQYLWLAETLAACARHEEAVTAYDRAIFQDHLNGEALEGKKRLVSRESRVARIPVYAKHPLLDAEFCRLVGKSAQAATGLHDAAVADLRNDRIAEALGWLDKAVAVEPEHSNSYFLRGKCFFLKKDYHQAEHDFAEAIRLSHRHHDAYHRSASAEHLARGLDFLAARETDLAIADFTKALDLHSGNKAARAARAQAYRNKGNTKLAEEDERALVLRV